MHRLETGAGSNPTATSSQRDRVLPKNNHRRHPLQSSFPSTGGASQVRRSEGAADDSSEVPFTREALLQSLTAWPIPKGSASLHPRLPHAARLRRLGAHILGRHQDRIKRIRATVLTPLAFAPFRPGSNIITDNGLIFRSAIFVSPTRLTTQSSVQIPIISNSSTEPRTPIQSRSLRLSAGVVTKVLLLVILLRLALVYPLFHRWSFRVGCQSRN